MAIKLKLMLQAVDTWFFRAGAPYYNEGASWPRVSSVFPPQPWVVTGAVRAFLARSRGWQDGTEWNDAFKMVLGDGPCDPGKLSFTGPFVTFNGQPVFPMPRHVVGRTSEADGKWKPAGFLLPSEETRPVSCDLGEVPLPLGPGRYEVTTKHWLTIEGLKSVLDGKLPDCSDVVHESYLYEKEPRTGIRRDLRKRSVEEGALFASEHVRTKASTAIVVEVGGLPDDWEPNETRSFIPFGAEGRMASCEKWDGEISFDFSDRDVASLKSSRQVTLIALTPALLDKKDIRGEEVIGDSGLKVVSASMDRPIRVGGWFSLRREPLPLRSALAPGSVLFCKASEPGRLAEKIERGMVRLGELTCLGFGIFAISAKPWGECERCKE